MGNFIIFLFIGLAAWWIIKKISKRMNEPPSNQGSFIRFKQCLTIKSWDCDEAQQIALTFEEPYKTKMLKQVWDKYCGIMSGTSEFDRFSWLEKLSPELREKVAPSECRRIGIKIIQFWISNPDCTLDWSFLKKTGYELSDSELKKLAKRGDSRAIEILNNRA